MATATIPELIQPGTLFTPDSSLFSIAAGELPNTDDALNLLGASGEYQAYQTATSGIHYPAAPADPFCVNFWIYETSANDSAAATSFPAQTLMGVTDLTASATNEHTTESTTGMRWWITKAASTTTRALSYSRAKDASSKAFLTISGIPQNTWTMVTINDPGGATAPSYYLNATPSTSGSAGTPGTPGTITNPRFHLGWWSTAGGWGSPDDNDKIAKIALFNRVLTGPEILDLYNSMTLGPPSP